MSRLRAGWAVFLNQFLNGQIRIRLCIKLLHLRTVSCEFDLFFLSHPYGIYLSPIDVENPAIFLLTERKVIEHYTHDHDQQHIHGCFSGHRIASIHLKIKPKLLGVVCLAACQRFLFLSPRTTPGCSALNQFQNNGWVFSYLGKYLTSGCAFPHF